MDELIPAGIYGRQSEGSVKSIAEQLAELAEDVAAQGARVIVRYSDPVSASRFGRAARGEWAKILADIDAGRIGMLGLWESSRGDRTLTTWSAMLDLCRERGCLIRVKTHQRTYDMSNARDWRSMAEDGVDSAYESEKTSARIRRTTAASAVAGRPHGPVRYGYERVYDASSGALLGEAAHPTQAPIVRGIVRQVGRNVPISEIARKLNAGGVPAPGGGRWYQSRVRAIALSPAYAGLRVHHGERYPATWPALVTQAAHLAAARVLGDPDRKTTRPGRQVWPLSYLARCAVCDGPLNRRGAGARWGEHYQCLRGHVSINAPGLDALVLDVLATWLADDPLFVSPSDDAGAVAARGEAEALGRRLDEWRDSAARGETSPASLARIEPQLAAEIKAAERRAQRASTPAVLLDVLDGAAGSGRLRIIRERLGALPAPGQREIIGSLLMIKIARATRRLVPGELLDVERVTIERRRP